MRNFTPLTPLLAAGMMLLGNAQAQDTPAKTTPAPAAKTQTAPAKTTATTPGTKAPTKTPPKTAKAGTVTVLKTTKDKFSYALGMNMGANMGANLRQHSVEFDPNLVAEGVKASLSGGKTLLTQQEAQAALMEVTNEVQKKQQEKALVAAAPNKKEGDAFLAANKAKESVVALPSGLQYKILKEGTGPKPTATDTVVCNYRGTLLNGTEFDSSSKHGGPATFAVNRVIKGWTEALQLMPAGSKWQLFIPSAMAYGDQGTPSGDIPPGATLIFEVELLSIQEKPKPAADAKPNTDAKPEEKK